MPTTSKILDRITRDGAMVAPEVGAGSFFCKCGSVLIGIEVDEDKKVWLVCGNCGNSILIGVSVVGGQDERS